jgi:seryl-tRNA synthetase
MIGNTIDKIEARIRGGKHLAAKDQAELLRLLASLKSEITELSKTRHEEAESIAGFIERSAHEAARQTKNPELLKHSINGLSASVKGFEASHPKLVEDVNYICTVLANMGI